VVLAYSGGLDTSFCIPYLQDQGYIVVAVTVDTGGFTQAELKKIKTKAKQLGVKKHFVIDGKQQLYDQIATYIIKGNILRGGVYPLSVGPERVIQAQEVVKVAQEFKATAVAHGSTGAGNDQVRFETYFQTLAPQLEVIAPIRELSLTRAEEIKYLQSKGFEVDETKHQCSINQGLLGTTIGGQETLDSWSSVPDEAYPAVVPLNDTPQEPVELTVEFKQGLPIKLNGKKLPALKLIAQLSQLGAKHGFGKNVHLGNTILGIKGRVAFEAPAILTLIKAHQELEKLVLTKHQAFWKDHLANVYGDLLHEAQYFDPVMKDIETLIDSSQQVVSGEVKIKLHHGNCQVLGVKSPHSLMNPDVASYGEENHLWTGQEAAGFSKIFGLQSSLAYQVNKQETKS